MATVGLSATPPTGSARGSTMTTTRLAIGDPQFWRRPLQHRMDDFAA